MLVVSGSKYPGKEARAVELYWWHWLVFTVMLGWNDGLGKV